MQIFTVGHSTRDEKEFITLLQEFNIEELADVRRYPGSKRNPQFNQRNLEKSLSSHNIDYIWLEQLGGRRRTPPQTSDILPKTGMRNAGFQHYAYYMKTDEFKNAITKLLSIAEKKKTAIMCAEKFYWRCHRRLISDYLLARGINVIHIEDTGKSYPHEMTPDLNSFYISGD